ncbi:UvrD-helicase domain-containing protein [Paenibacillus sp. 843]
MGKQQIEELKNYAEKALDAYFDSESVASKENNPVQEEQIVLNDKVVAIEGVLNDLRSKKTPSDFQLAEKHREKIKWTEGALFSPYFGRIDIIEDGIPDTLYIGEVGIANDNNELIVVNWQADIAKVFYSYNGGNPKVEYIANDEKRTVDVQRKRQIHIEDRKVLNVIENESGKIAKKTIARKSPQGEETTTSGTIDDFLSYILSGKSDTHKFKDIIASIQSEQDEIIRLGLDKPIVVQGAAGSGKSSIALHRMSYLMYKYREQWLPEDIMIIAPNKMFISYMESVLPKLKISGARQSTFYEWATEGLKGLKLEFKEPYDTIQTYMDDKSGRNEFLLKFKGSLKIKEAIDKLLDLLESSPLPQGDLDIGITKYKHSDIVKYYEGKRYLPVNKRITELINHLKDWTIEQQYNAVDEIKNKANDIQENWIGMLPEGSEGRKVLFEQIDKIKELKITKIKSNSKMLLDRYLKRLTRIDPVTVYSQLFEPEILKSMNLGLSDKEVELLCSDMRFEGEKPFSYEDLAPLSYINSRVNGWAKKYEYVVIDEAQDQSPFEICLLHNTAKSVCILGDMAQSIYSFRSISGWDQVIKEVFQQSAVFLKLQLSYRSTFEIMNLANGIIEKSNLSLPKIVPINRHGEKPTIQRILNGKDLIDNIRNSIGIFEDKGYKTIAIICKDLKQAKNLFENVNEPSIQLVSDPHQKLEKKIVVIPGYLAKGLEFDAVILANASKERFDPSDPIDAKMLFVSATRAHHDLHIFYHEELTPLLNNGKVDLSGHDLLEDIL